MRDQADAGGPETRVMLGARDLRAELRAELAPDGGDVHADLFEHAAMQHTHHAAATGGSIGRRTRPCGADEASFRWPWRGGRCGGGCGEPDGAPARFGVASTLCVRRVPALRVLTLGMLALRMLERRVLNRLERSAKLVAQALEPGTGSVLQVGVRRRGNVGHPVLIYLVFGACSMPKDEVARNGGVLRERRRALSIRRAGGRSVRIAGSAPNLGASCAWTLQVHEVSPRRFAVRGADRET